MSEKVLSKAIVTFENFIFITNVVPKTLIHVLYAILVGSLTGQGKVPLTLRKTPQSTAIGWG